MNESPNQSDQTGSTGHPGPHPGQADFGGPNQWGPQFTNQNPLGSRPQQPYANEGFFQSIRNSGWFRAENRIIGGVCAGISAKTGWDLALVRALAVILSVITFPVVALYAIAWMLLPEQIDGRIHLESLIHGRWDIAQFGAILMFIAAIPVVSLSFSTGSPVVLTFILVGLVALIACAVILIVHVSKGADPTTRPSPRFPSTPQPTVSSAQTPAWSAAASAPSSTAWQPWQQTPQAQPWYGQFEAGYQPTVEMPVDGEGARDKGAGEKPADELNTDPAPDVKNWREVEQPAPSTPEAAQAWSPANQMSGTNGPTAGGPQVGPSLPAAQPGQAWSWNTPPVNPWNNTAYSQFQPNNTVWVPPLPPQRKPFSGAASVVVLGLVLIVLAATFALMWDFGVHNASLSVARSAMVGGAACLIIVGAAICWAAIKDRSAVWLSVLAAIGLCLALPTGLIGMTTINFSQPSSGFSSSGFSTSVDEEASFDWQTDDIQPGAASWVTLDLRDAPQRTVKTIRINSYMEQFTIKVEEGQHVIIQASDPLSVGDLTHFDYQPTEMGDPPTDLSWVPWLADWQSQGGPIKMPGSTLDNAIQVVLNDPVGSLTIEQFNDSHARLDDQASPQSGDVESPQSGRSGDSSQSGETGQSGSSGHSDSSSPTPSANTNNTSYERIAVTSGVNNEH